VAGLREEVQGWLQEQKAQVALETQKTIERENLIRSECANLQAQLDQVRVEIEARMQAERVKAT
jgi:hypothetical protein